MIWREDLRMAGRALRGNAFRSGLTVLGITVGAFAIVLMTSLAQSGLSTLGRSFEEMGGARLILLVPKVPEKGEERRARYAKGLTLQDRDVLLARLPHLRHAAMLTKEGRKDLVAATGASTRADVLTGDPGVLRAYNLRLLRGRNLGREDARDRARVCVVAYDVAHALWGGDAVGQWLTVEGLRCQVVGQLAKVDHWGTNFGFEWTNFVLVPLEAWADERPQVVSAAMLLLQTDDPGHNDLVKRIANALLFERHHGVDDFQIWDFQTVMKQFDVIFQVMQAIVGVLASIALLVGGIGVMNMMLVSVSERVREIGIRKAIGASPSDIQRQFLLEAALLAGSGGALGVLGGTGMALVGHEIIARFKPSWVAELSTTAIALAMGVSLGLGLAFGFFPARRAARLDPVQAIRA